MNWVGGARNRVKLKHEKKIQKEFFERKRHTKKVLRAKQEDCQENEGKTGISQDLIALQAIVSAHDKPKRKSRETRRPHTIDLDEAKRNDHPRRKYCVELPESPGHHKPSTLDICGTIPESFHAEKKLQSNQPWTKHNIRESILKHEASCDAQKRRLLPPKKTLSIQSWTNSSQRVTETPFLEPSSVKEHPKPFVDNFTRKLDIQEFQKLSCNQKHQSTKSFEDEKSQKDSGDYFYCTPIKQRRTTEGKFLCFEDNEFLKTSAMKSSDFSASKIKPLASPFVPFSEPGPLSKFNIIESKNQQEPKNNNFYSQTFNIISNGETTQLSNTRKITADLYPENKPTPLESPVQTWTTRKTEIDHKDPAWSHFQILPGHPPRKNPFFNKETQIEKNPPISEEKENDNLPCNIQYQEKSENNAEMTNGKTHAIKWNPFNLSYPVKIESGGTRENSLGCGQETAWRTFLEDSRRLSSDSLQSLARNQHIDNPANLGVPFEIEEAPEKIVTPEQEAENFKITNDSFTPESEVRGSFHHEALKEVMDLDRDEQSSELTSSWSSTFTDETAEGNRLEVFDDHEADKAISSKNSQFESESIEKWQSIGSMSSTIKASPQLERITSNVHYQVKINVNQSEKLTRSPTVFLKCTESIDFFDEVEDKKADSREDLGHEVFTNVGEGGRGQCHNDREEIQATEKLRKKLESSPKQVQSMHQEEGTQTQREYLKIRKCGETEAQTTEQGTQTESDIFYRMCGRDAKTTQTENDKCLESAQQEVTKPPKDKLSETGNEVETIPITKADGCPCGYDINKYAELFAAKQLKEGSDEQEVKKKKKRSVNVQIPSSTHVILDNLQSNVVLDNVDVLSNERNTNWYLSLLINILTCDADCYGFNGGVN